MPKHFYGILMTQKSARFQDHYITQNNNTINVYHAYDNVIESLRNIADEIGFTYDSKWNTRTFGLALIKAYGTADTAHIGNHIIYKLDNGTIQTFTLINPNTTKSVLENIAFNSGYPCDENTILLATTPQLGDKLIDFLNQKHQI